MTFQSRIKIAIIGAGPVGSLCACFMAEYGYDVTVYESRTDIRHTETTIGRSINMALSERGINALQFINLDNIVIDELAEPMYGRMIHSIDGRKYNILYDILENKCLYSVNRNDLNAVLLTKLEKYQNVKLNFSHKLVDIDFKTTQLTFETLENPQKIVKPDIVIGCDGAYSTVRKNMIRLPMFNYSQMYIDHGYLEINLPSNLNKDILSAHYLHIWPRGTFMLIALPNKDKSWTCTLFMPMDKFPLLLESETENILSFFYKHFKDFTNLIHPKYLIDQVKNGKARTLISIKCNPYHVNDNFLLIGDAAHAIVPFYGQGMNAGFEDCTLLNLLLNEYEHDLNTVIKMFTSRRIHDTEAISDLAFYNYTEMRDLVARKSFLWRKKIDNILQKWFPQTWIPLHSSVSFTTIGYKQCQLNNQCQNKILFLVLILFATMFGIAMYFIVMSTSTTISA
ncbi:Kynurenine 3-monooxygenase,FAD-binding domain,FAD/NAD(P)-binding domain [Cinara cedri]|uniref:Kynurenine 3-monooxygenase n=1 Tax=Cinara cedri TaxID=506608 RepID=A0A5E4N7Y0_9HEMI|nr:Kynurenine 3-monooxygenase,FAD-binding domain,FAD/NAD(P)-binding domain [Cinara cedri]